MPAAGLRVCTGQQFERSDDGIAFLGAPSTFSQLRHGGDPHYTDTGDPPGAQILDLHDDGDFDRHIVIADSVSVARASVGDTVVRPTIPRMSTNHSEAKPTALSSHAYEKNLARLQRELVKLQEWVRHEGLKMCVLFEGRDAAGKGGTIKRIVERTNPRVVRVAALGTPDREGEDAVVLPALRVAPAGRR